MLIIQVCSSLDNVVELNPKHFGDCVVARGIGSGPPFDRYYSLQDVIACGLARICHTVNDSLIAHVENIEGQ